LTFSIETSRPDDIEQDTFTSYAEAVAALSAWGHEKWEDGYVLDEGWASRDNLYAIRAVRLSGDEVTAGIVKDES
jgi:hypothetical protein